MTEGLDGTVCADLSPFAVNSMKTGYVASLQDIMGGIHFKCDSWFLSASA